MSNITTTLKYFTALALTLLVASIFAANVHATQVQEKVNICHTGNGKNWEDVEVDKDAWDEHTSAHSEHEQDFLITEEAPCPPATPEDCDTLYEVETKEDAHYKNVAIEFIETDADGEPDSVKITPDEGYKIVKVELKVDSYDPADYKDYTENFPGTFNPEDGEDVNYAKVVVQKDCPIDDPGDPPVATPPATTNTPTVLPMTGDNALIWLVIAVVGIATGLAIFQTLRKKD